MTKKIFLYMFSSILAVASIVAVVGGFILRSQLENQNSAYLKTTLFSVSTYLQQLQEQPAEEPNAIAKGIDYLRIISSVSRDRRFTWIDSDGTVLFDSHSYTGQLDNHRNRPEILLAQSSGYGQSNRYSDTLLEQTMYAARLLPDNSILRTSISSKSVFSIIAQIVPPFLCFIFVLMMVSVVLSIRIARHLLKPINTINLEEPEKNDSVTYEEIEPLISRLCKQKAETEKSIVKQQRQRMEFEEITSSLNEGLVILNKESHIISINDSALALFNIKKQDSLEKHISILSRDKDFISLAEKGCHKSTEIQMQLNGSWYRFSANPAYTDRAQTRATGCIILIVDITASKTAEEMRKTFSANVSHELKTPLTSISGYAEIIRAGIASAQDIPDFANRIYRESTRLLSLINDIIRLSQLDEETPDIVPVNLSDVTKDICTRIEQYPELKQKNLLLTEFIEPDVIVNGYISILEEMIFNLFDNAVKYNKHNGSITVRLETDKTAEPYVRLIISDTGIGIPKAEHTKVFERFYRVDKSHSKETGGTGLGLAIVKHAALYHNAHLTLDSILGEGTKITVQFPL